MSRTQYMRKRKAFKITHRLLIAIVFVSVQELKPTPKDENCVCTCPSVYLTSMEDFRRLKLHN